MSIVNALTTCDIREAAIAWAKSGVSVIPLIGKAAAGNWKAAQERRASPLEVANTFRPFKGYGLGIVCGAVSSNLIVIDCDGLEASNLFWFTFPELQETLTVKTGSGKGYHLYYWCQSLTPTTRAVGLPQGNIELRSSGTYVVAPPSTHPVTRARYEIKELMPPKVVPNLNRVAKWLQELKAEKGGVEKAVPKSPVPLTANNLRSMRYGQAALSFERLKVVQATEGNRNNALYLAAFNLGQLVADGALTGDQIESELLPAAQSVGLSDSEAIKTIKSGITRGLTKPRSKR
jgi:Bifunctional DNA primase/polymerase, N-terminal